MLAIDHIVIASKNPEQDAKEFEEKFGVKTISGGKHTNWGTYNYLSFFNNNSYLEWLGVYDEELARKSDNPLIQRLVHFFDEGKTGPVTYALRTKDMNYQLKHLNKHSIPFVGPLPGARKREDGSTLSWRMLFPNHEQDLPFLIEWGDSINLPSDKAMINSEKITTVQVSEKIDAYAAVFQFDSGEITVQLENGKLKFTNNQMLDFNIN